MVFVKECQKLITAQTMQNKYLVYTYISFLESNNVLITVDRASIWVSHSPFRFHTLFFYFIFHFCPNRLQLFNYLSLTDSLIPPASLHLSILIFFLVHLLYSTNIFAHCYWQGFMFFYSHLTRKSCCVEMNGRKKIDFWLLLVNCRKCWTWNGYGREEER